MLQWCRLACAVEECGDTAERTFGAGGCDRRDAPSAYDDGPGAQWRAGILVDRDGLPGKHGFVDEEGGCLDELGVGSDDISPSPSSSTSPGTTTTAATSRAEPFRITRALGVDIADRAATAWSARISCATPTVVLKTITRPMTTASAWSPITIVSSATPSNTMISGSPSCAMTRLYRGALRTSATSLRP